MTLVKYYYCKNKWLGYIVYESCVDYSITITVEDKLISDQRCTKQQAFIIFLWLFNMYSVRNCKHSIFAIFYKIIIIWKCNTYPFSLIKNLLTFKPILFMKRDLYRNKLF